MPPAFAVVNPTVALTSFLYIQLMQRFRWWNEASDGTAIGGPAVAGIAAIGIIAPLISDLGLPSVLVMLAVGAGGCFGGQFSDDAFWMLRSLFALTTRPGRPIPGQSMLALVVLGIVIVIDVFL